jgi:hypothetical protein
MLGLLHVYPHCRLGQITRAAMERCIQQRTEYKTLLCDLYYSWQLVYVDESAADRRTTFRGMAWAVKGTRAVRKVFFVRGRRYI